MSEDLNNTAPETNHLTPPEIAEVTDDSSILRPLTNPGEIRTETPKIELLERTLSNYTGKNLLILLKGAPDPDCIASAWALRFISSKFGISSTILYSDKLSHQENRALVKQMEIPMVFFSEHFDVKEFDGYCIVDSPMTDLPLFDEVPDTFPLVVHVDHHKSSMSTAEFYDVREHAGSTASIFAEYLRDGTNGLITSNSECMQIATSLMHGIRSDTDGFYLAREIDYLGAAYLSMYADSDLMKIISAQLIPPKTMDILHRALQSKAIRDNYLLTGVGFVREEDRDGIPQAADYLLRREGIDTVFAYGIVDEKYIEGSLRTRSKVFDPDQFLKEILGQDRAGKPYGGGRLDKGGFKIPVGMFAKCGDKQLLWDMTKKTMSGIFCKALGISVPDFEGPESKLLKTSGSE